MRKARYLHIIWHPDLKFIPYMVAMFNEYTEFFSKEEHVFVTPHKRVYDAISPKYEIYLEGNAEENLINRFGEYADWIFVHAMNCKRSVLVFTKKKYAKKVIWRTWGHDMRPLAIEHGSLIKKILTRGLFFCYKKKVRQFKAIGVANDIDSVNVNKTFGELNTVVLNYIELNNGALREIEKAKKSKCDPVKILIGHSGSPFDCHIEAMNKLMAYRNENIRICLILSYGGPTEYISQVRAYAETQFPGKCEIIDSFMSKQDYIQYISTIDIALFPQLHSTALGNLVWLLHFHIPLFVAEEGQFAESFRRNNCSYCSYDSIGKVDFNEIMEMKNSDELELIYGKIKGADQICEGWKRVLDDLKDGRL